jgi:hypothetical protein
MRTHRHRTLLFSIVLAGANFANELSVPGARAAEQTAKDVIAAQIRTQGFVCDKPQRAVRDAKLSKPNHDVWVLTCTNATYRFSRYPDMAAKVEQLR